MKSGAYDRWMEPPNVYRARFDEVATGGRRRIMLQCSAVSDDSGVGAGGADALVVDPVIEMEEAVPDNRSGDGVT